MGIPVVDEIGLRIARAWRAVEFDRPIFAQLSAEHLDAANLSTRLDPDEIAAAVFGGQLPEQSDPTARFGQPPVTLFRTPRFYISALFWLDGTTAIHDHGFSGAFQVLSGSSIETNYEFAPFREIGGHLRFGELLVRGSALRRAGDVRAVPAGPSYIHALFHLARPSVSLVVRTFTETVPIGQFEYSPAGIADHSFFDDPIRDRMVQMIESLRKIDHPKLEQWVGDLVAESDSNTALAILRSMSTVPDEALVDRLVDKLRDEDARNRMRSWFFHRRRIAFLVSRRNTVYDPQLRFLLAVLMNAQNRSDALALVAAHSPDVKPAAQVAAWLRQLSALRLRFQVGNTPFEPNVLGLPSFEPGAEETVADYLSNRERPFMPEERTFLERLRTLPSLHPLFV